MSQQSKSVALAWTKPVLSRLGQLKDVAPNVAGASEGVNNRS